MARNRKNQKRTKRISRRNSQRRRRKKSQTEEPTLIIETDLLFSYIKKEDWLRPTAVKIIKNTANGEYGKVKATRECLHELYYVSNEAGAELDEIISRIGALTAIDNLNFIETTKDIDLVALTLMKQHELTSIFDAYHAATALEKDKDKLIISTDQVYDKIPDLKRKDPRKMTK